MAARRAQKRRKYCPLAAMPPAACRLFPSSEIFFRLGIDNFPVIAYNIHVACEKHQLHKR